MSCDTDGLPLGGLSGLWVAPPCTASAARAAAGVAAAGPTAVAGVAPVAARAPAGAGG